LQLNFIRFRISKAKNEVANIPRNIAASPPVARSFSHNDLIARISIKPNFDVIRFFNSLEAKVAQILFSMNVPLAVVSEDVALQDRPAEVLQILG
jgi:hypothetical protein